MRLFARRFLLIFMLGAVMDGQWAMMQSIAWTGMLVSHLRTAPLPQAVSLTFDGQHPCPLCNAISQGKKSEKKSDLTSKLTRLEFLPLAHLCNLCPPDRNSLSPPRSSDFARQHFPQPLTPPPRATCA
jgi:hypothetical protein